MALSMTTANKLKQKRSITKSFKRILSGHISLSIQI